MHGEFKVPGGKLVVVDLEVADGKLADVRVSGDFFLEPDEALPAIDAALTGLPVTSESAQLAAAVTAALPEGAVLLGFSAEAIATTVRRALKRATEWSDYSWQLVHPGPLDPLLHLALDQVLAEEVGDGRRAPTLRIWEWASPAVVIGSFQSVKNEVDAGNATKYGFPVVRRISGGGAMFIEPAGAVTYSIYAPIDLVQGLQSLGIADSYAFFDEWAVQALQSLGT